MSISERVDRRQHHAVELCAALAALNLEQRRIASTFPAGSPAMALRRSPCPRGVLIVINLLAIGRVSIEEVERAASPVLALGPTPDLKKPALPEFAAGVSFRAELKKATAPTPINSNATPALIADSEPVVASPKPTKPPDPDPVGVSWSKNSRVPARHSWFLSLLHGLRQHVANMHIAATIALGRSITLAMSSAPTIQRVVIRHGVLDLRGPRAYPQTPQLDPPLN